MQNATQSRTTTKDAPIMRSVMIAPPPPMPLLSQRPLANVSNKKEYFNKHVTTDCSWIINQLTPVPSFYILERTHVKLSSVAPQEVAKRISDCFRTESIAAEFDSAKARAMAETRDHIQIMVQLFKNGEVIIVEIQRLMGCSFGFHQTAKTVLNAAKGGERQPTPSMRFPVRSVPVKNNQSQIVEECLENVNNMLKGKQLDTDILAMETLSQLTNSNSPCRAYVAQSVLMGPLLKAVTRLIECDSIDDTEIAQPSLLRRLALTIFADCLDASLKSDKLGAIIKQNTDICCNKLMLALTNDLRSSCVQPHEACEAVRCLMPLIQSTPEILSMVDITDAVSHAFQAGSMSHSMLETESSRLQQMLSCN